MISINIPAKMGRNLSRFVAIPSWNMWKKKMMTTQMEMIKTHRERERERSLYMNVQSANQSGWLTSRPHPSEAIHRGDTHTHTHTHTTWQHTAHRLDLLSNDLCRSIVAQLNFLFFFFLFPHSISSKTKEFKAIWWWKKAMLFVSAQYSVTY
jgi:hypothetical protein